MCFSASVSFGAGIILTAISVITISKVTKPSNIYFASIPLILAIQQFSKGFLWLGLTDPVFAPFQNLGICFSLFFTQIIWPIGIPLSILKLEAKGNINRFIKPLLGIGIIVSIYQIISFISFHVDTEIINHHINFIKNYPFFLDNYANLLFIIATVVPMLISNIKHMWVLGMIVFSSYIITFLFHSDNLILVWCYFSIIIGLAVLALISQIENPKTEEEINQV